MGVRPRRRDLRLAGDGAFPDHWFHLSSHFPSSFAQRWMKTFLLSRELGGHCRAAVSPSQSRLNPR